MSEANVELARRGFAAAARGDLDAIGDLLDSQVKWHGGDPAADGACRNRDQVLAFMRQARRRRGVGELVDVIDAGERVVVILRPGGGGAKAQPVANLTTFRDGKVVEMVHFADVEQALASVRVP
jgi:ketosteroid isomerase-like protein